MQLLTRQELVELTGCRRRAGVIRWLQQRGWVHEINANGWPVVSAAHAEARLGGGTTANRIAARPNVEALRALQASR